MKRTKPIDIQRMTKEQVLVAAKLHAPEIRFLVSNYYDSQEMRKRGDMQLRHLGEKTDPHVVHILEHTTNAFAVIEEEVQKMLGEFARSNPPGRWMLAQHGVGPVISAGFLAFIDINKAPTAGHIWRFAGLDPSVEWYGAEKAAKMVNDFVSSRTPTIEDVVGLANLTKRQPDTLVRLATKDRDGKPQTLTKRSISAALAKRPYNARMKQLCFHFGECIKRTHNSPNSFYGRIYEEQKAKVIARNNAGEYAERARHFVSNSPDVKKKLAEGFLPDGNLDRQATRFVTKIFLSHLHALMFWDKFGRPPPKPFAIAILGHAHELPIPMTEMFPGFAEAYYGSGVSEAAE